MIKISNDPTTNIFMLNIIDNEHINYLNDFCDEVEKRNFTCFSNDTQIYLFFDKWYNEFVKSATIEERENLKRYSGQDFLNTNAVLRNNWNYEVNGLYSEKDARTYRDFSEKLNNIFLIHGCSLDSNIKSYRGLSLSAFKKFGINSMQDLPSLKNQFYYDAGFTSTSLIRDNSFFNKELHPDCNIEIEFLIPEESLDTIPLITIEYSGKQTELLFNSGGLFKIIDVNIVGDKAYLKAIHLPQNVWDKNYHRRFENIEENRKTI